MSRPQLRDIKKPFSCGSTLRSDSTASESWVTEQFSSLDAAEERYAEVYADPLRFAYLGEVGVFDNDAGNLEIDWITFRTNNDAWWEKVGVRNGAHNKNVRGWGQPLSKEGKYVVPYQIFENLRKP